ncbi:MAG: PAS domain S-box protein, partial [Candidatus Bathyarchaeia archaeon]
RDLTERKKTEEKMRKLNRALLAVGKSNEALLRATDAASLVQEVCRIAVKDCGYDLAWVGLVEHGEDKTVRPVAYEGFDKEYVDSLKITWADTERGMGPTGRAVRTGKPQLCSDIRVDADFAPWREQAAKKGYTSSLALPLRDEREVIGVLNIYSREPNAFSDEEILLLDSLAKDLGYGLTALKARAEKEKMEKAVAAAKEEWEQTFHTMPDAIAIIDANYRIMRANQTMTQKLGLELKELVGLTCYKQIHGADYPPEFCPHAQTMKDGKEHAAEIHIPKLGRYFMIRTSPLKDANGHVTATVHVATDITERKKTEETLLERERQFRSLFEHSLDGIMLTKPDGTILAANPQACRMLGMTEDEIKKAGREGLVVKDEKLEAALAERERTGHAVAELTFRRKNGTTFIANVSSNVFTDAGGEAKTSLSIRDITEYKKAEDALKQSEQRFRDFLDSMPEIVFETDCQGKLLYINRTA